MATYLKEGSGEDLAAIGQIPYVLDTVLAFLSPYITLAICAACAVYYALPVASRGAGGQSDASIA